MSWQKGGREIAIACDPFQPRLAIISPSCQRPWPALLVGPLSETFTLQLFVSKPNRSSMLLFISF
jgi:hypothetical protein